MGFSANATKFLKDFGDYSIDHLEIVRTPVSSKITGLLNAITAGKFSEAKKKANYDKLFHLAILIHVEKTTNVITDDMMGSIGITKKNKTLTLQLEKNERLRFGGVTGITKDTEYKYVSFRSPITVKDLIDRTRRRMGDEAFFRYSAFDHNCQDFVLNVLEASNLATPDIKHFVKQDTVEILKHLPSYTERLANGITDLASYFTPDSKAEKYVRPERKGDYKIVSIMLSKKKFNIDEASHWTREHKYDTSMFDSTHDYYRFRQMPIELERTGRYDIRVIPLGDDGMMKVGYL